MTSTERTQQEFMERCAALDGAALGEGAFSPGPAIWVGHREVAHYDADGSLDVRLTRGVIRRRRDDMLADPRIALRASASDWLEMSLDLTSATDVADALALVGAAIAANGPTAEPGPPPTGSELERRRRFH